MDLSKRSELATHSLATANKKVADVLARRDEFEPILKREAEKVLGSEEAKPFNAGKEADLVEGRDIAVCVRLRPALAHESAFFPCTFAKNPKVACLEPRLSVRGEAKPVVNAFEVDYAFAPENDNQAVYSVYE